MSILSFRRHMLALVACTLAVLPRLLGAAEPSAPAPAYDAQMGPKVARPLQPGFWQMRFNSPEGFRNLGIETYRHETMISRKLRLNGAAETTVGYTVYLPPAYAADSDTRFPILYFLAGNGGTENVSSIVVKTAHELIVKGELPPFVVVGITGGRSYYGNQFEGRCQVQDFFLDEFVAHIEKTYRIKGEPRFRHLQGMSAGGNGAVIYGLQRPDLFGTVTAIAGAFLGVRYNAWPDMYDAKEEHYRPYNPFVLATENQRRIGNLRIALWLGSADETTKDHAPFLQLLKESGIPHTLNDWNARPKLQGVAHQFNRYYELCGKEILEFHAEAFRL